MALKLSIGAVQSPYVRSLGCNGLDSHCPFCGAKNVFWEHLWLCGMQQDPPEDTMLQRFGWPVNNDSFKSFPAVSWGGQELCWFLQSPTHQSGECRPLPIMPALGMQATPYNACWESNPLPLMPAWFFFCGLSVSFSPWELPPKRLSPIGNNRGWNPNWLCGSVQWNMTFWWESKGASRSMPRSPTKIAAPIERWSTTTSHEARNG